ncbi:MAG: DeoR/GlpR family DNA-binding transcription regulator [Actinomycetota bacterium]|nr:DeoR/GlpR family DNA-binding transcription regulator [Actinomycetota bacterium]
MYAEERQKMILDQARAHGRVEVTALADTFSVTTETIRRDLSILERLGMVRRVHGGALLVERINFEPGRGLAEDQMMAEKRRIAKAALAEVPKEGSILIDAGTTTARLADEIPADRDLTVITPSLPIALSLTARPKLEIMLIGGRLRANTLATVDSWALQALRDTFVDVAFLTTSGISAARGLTTPDLAEAAIKRAAVAGSRQCVVLADHTKIGNDYFTRFAELHEIDTFVTDDGADPEAIAGIRRGGPNVILA